MKQGSQVCVSILVGLFCVSQWALADSVYKWTDKNGEIHFSDQPKAGAEKMHLKELQTIDSADPGMGLSPDATTPPPPSTLKSPASSDHVYTVLKISQPMLDQVIRNNDGVVIVQVTLDPQLFEGDKVQIVFDSQAMGEPQASTSLSLSNVVRGTHTVAARIVDSGGNTIAESDGVTFNMQRIRDMHLQSPAK